MRKRVVIVLSGLWAILLLLPTSAQQSIRPAAYNEIYGSETQRNRRLDVYLPSDSEASVPVVVMLHGSPGSKGDFVSLGIPALAVEHGYAAVSVGYVTTYPAALGDVYCALGWIVAHSEEYGFDPHRIALFGVSFGGYVSALIASVDDRAAYHTDCPYTLPDAFSLAGVATNAGVFFASLDGITGYLETVPELMPDVDAETLAASIELLRANPPNMWRDLEFPDSLRAILREYPIYWVDGNEPPHLLIHGVGDSNVPYEDAFDYGHILATNHVNVQLVIDRLSGHVPPPRVFDVELVAFLGRIFGN